MSDSALEMRSHNMDAAIDFVSGVAGGTASVYVGQPLDTVKVKMQTFPHLYKNAFSCFVKTYKIEGLTRGLYAGTVPSLAAQVAENSILFMMYGVCQKMVLFFHPNKQHVNELSSLENAVSGGSAAFFSSLALCPTELIKCKLQAMQELVNSGKMTAVEHRNLVGPYSLTKHVLRTEGLRGLFKGLGATIAREMPGYFFFFGGYELMKTTLTPPGKTKDDVGALRTMACGAFGGMCFWVSVFPADVIKSRAQIETSSAKQSSRGFLPMMSQIARNEGIGALYCGLGPSLLRTVPATAGLFLAYESTKKYLSNIAYNNDS